MPSSSRCGRGFGSLSISVGSSPFLISQLKMKKQQRKEIGNKIRTGNGQY